MSGSRVVVELSLSLTRQARILRLKLSIVSEALHTVKCPIVRTPSLNNVFFPQRFKGVAFRDLLRWIQGQPVGLQDPLPLRHYFFVICAIPLVRDDGCALVDIGADSAQVVPVVVRIHHEANRLVGNEFLHFLDNREGTVARSGGLDDYRVIAELDGHAVVRRTSQIPDPIRQLFRLHADRRDGCLAHGGRDG